MKRFLSFLMTALLLVTLCVPALAADSAVGTTLRMSETEGTVTVRDAAGKDKTVRADMRIYNGYVIETGKSSSAFITLDDAKAVKLDTSTRVEIKQNGKKLEVALSAGKLFCDVEKPLKANESLSIRTSTMVTGVRGSGVFATPTEIGYAYGHGWVAETGPELETLRVVEIVGGEGARINESTGNMEVELLTNENIPAVAAEMIAADLGKQAQVDAQGSNLTGKGIADLAPEKRAQESAEENGKAATADTALLGQNQTVSQTTDYAPITPATPSTELPSMRPLDPSDTSGGDDSGVLAPSGNPSDSQALMAQLASGSATLDTSGGWTISYSGVTVGAGQALNITGTGTVSMPGLNIAAGGTVNVATGSTLAVSGVDLVYRGTLTNNGTVSSSAEQALLGTIVNNGTFVNSSVLAIAPGASFTGGTVSNTGTVIVGSGGTFTPNSVNGTVIQDNYSGQ